MLVMKKFTKILCCVLAMLLLAGCANAIEGNATTQTTKQEDDGVMNILLIGNSSCYYWTDELWGMLDAAGYEEVNVYNLYYSGATLEQHYNWWKNGEGACELICVNAQGRNSMKGIRLADALSLQDWDNISFLQASKYYLGNFEDAMASVTPYFGELLDFVKEKAPNAKIFWQESWASEFGYVRADFTMDTLEKQETMASMIQQVSAKVTETYGLPVVHISSIWQSVRNDAMFAQPGENSGMEKFTLCTRLNSGKLMDDFDHDGDVGGGQYLNACAFYEAFTGKDCRENTFRPKYTYLSMDYSLTEEEISALQNAAHSAGK